MTVLNSAGGVPWIVGTRIAVPQGVVAAGGANGDNYTLGGGVAANGTDCIFNSTYPAGYLAYPPAAWSNISVANVVPAGTLAIRIAGNLIMTAGTIQQGNSGAVDQDFRCNFAQTGYRPPKETYCWQAILSLFTGIRQTASVWVALDANLTFDFWWNALINGQPNYGNYPEYPTIELHAWVEACLLP